MFKKHWTAPGTALWLALGVCAALPAQEPDQLTLHDLAGARPKLSWAGARARARSAASTAAGTTPTGAAGLAGLPGIDSLTNFTGQFTANGFDFFGNPNRHWAYNMVGTTPGSNSTTVINAPIIPVSLDLRNADGSPRFVNGHRLFSDARQFVRPVLNSPVFSISRYSSSETPTQITDAIQRAEFGDQAEDKWHTMLHPDVKTARVMKLIRGTYYFSLNADGTCCEYVLIDEGAFVNALFPPTYPFDASTVIGAAELAGDMTTSDMTTLLFPNAFLFSNGDPNQCCVLGFHSFDAEPGTVSNGNRQRFYVMNYSSWISPGLFGGGFEDVTALSHEIAETFNDPFVAFDGVHNITPWWTENGSCGDILEVGDVIEVLPNATYPITMHGYTYHPQNEALLPWFEFRSPSTALHGAYSYPDETLLTALSLPQKAGCVP